MRSALANTMGIISYEVDWETGVAHLVYDEAVIPFDKVKEIFEAAKFKVRRIK